MTELLSLTPLSPRILPENGNSDDYAVFVDSVLGAADRLIGTLTPEPDKRIWGPQKVYNKSTCPTLTYTSRQTPPGTPLSAWNWHARQSRHETSGGGDFEAWRAGLLIDHTEHEREYIESLEHVEKIRTIHAGELEVWRACYKLKMASSRDFAFVILTKDTTPEGAQPGHRSFTVVSIPYEYPSQPSWTRSKYVSVEHVREEGNVIMWTMATSSDAGGMVPRMFSERAMPSKIAEDVPSFIRWLEKRRVSQ